MAPKSPWTDRTNVNKDHQAAAPRDAASPAINYAEAQTDEIEVLQAIYGDSYEEVVVKGAWSKTSDRAFRITLQPSSEHAKPEDFVILEVKLTATYPKTAPLLEVEGLQKFHERTQKSIMNIIHRRPQDMIGGVMIHDLAVEIQDVLEDAITARASGALPSLDDERASAEEHALTEAKKAEAAEDLRLKTEQEEADRMLKQMVSQEVSRRDRQKSLKPGDLPDLDDEDDIPSVVGFDQTAKIVVKNDMATFREVSIVTLLSTTGAVRSFLGKPKTANVKNAPLVAVLHRKVEKARSEILELEAVLESAYKLRHRNLVNVFAYRVERVNNFNSVLYICREYMEKGSLHDFLSMSNVHVNKARQFTSQLLEGLDFLHHNGLFHGGVHTKTIYLCNASNPYPKLADFGYAGMLGLHDCGLPPPWKSPDATSTSLAARRRSDIWDLAVVLVHMFLGLDTPSEYGSPASMLSRVNFSSSFEDLLHKMFATDNKKRPSCFDLLPAEFLRTDSPALEDDSAKSQHRTRKASASVASPFPHRSRHNSTNVADFFSRYTKEFDEFGRLGKGGFGEVVQARHKLDNGVYAVKKIKQAPQLLEKVLSEVVLLNRLNHPYVVRYHSTWVEDAASGLIQEEALSTTDDTMSDSQGINFGYTSTGGLDFVSSSGYHDVEFGDEEDEEDDDDNGSDDDIFDRGSDTDNDAEVSSTIDDSTTASKSMNLKMGRARSDSHRPPSTLFIQMELCERRSLRDLIRRKIDEDDCWRIMRQITEGLAHIHHHGIIHRDLKPDNVFIDNTGNPKIGDFGLATTGWQDSFDNQTGSKGQSGGDMTRSVGTALYVAPELHSNSGSAYTEKVDIYSLGIMFYEMCHQPFSTASERIFDISSIRRKDHSLPAEFRADGEKATQGKLVSALISHKPCERPTSSALLRSELLPVKIEDETIRQALNGLSDPRSPYHQTLMSALFAHDNASTQRVKAGAWEAKAPKTPEKATRMLLRTIARSSLETVFKRHGAVETHRDGIFPRSGMYTDPRVVQLLDTHGNMLQLPYDLTLPHAQQLARQPANLRCTFTFGGAYRETFKGGPPKVSEEADFDIIDMTREDDPAINDAEVVKVLDEFIAELQYLDTSGGISLNINHGQLLDHILHHARVPAKLQYATTEILSKLDVKATWTKLRPELRDIGLPDSTLDDLQTFHWRESPSKAFSRLRDLLGEIDAQTKAKLDEALQYLTRVLGFAEQFGIVRKIYFAPLSCVNAKFYRDGMLLQCLLEEKKKTTVLAAGGRYDSLIQSFRSPGDSSPRQGAVGLVIAMDGIVAHMVTSMTPEGKSKFLKDSNTDNIQIPKRCEVLVAATGTEKLRDAGLKVVSSLWAHDISAELDREHRSVPHSDYTFIVSMRHETSTTARVTNTTNDNEPTNIEISALASHILQELRSREGAKATQPPLLRNHSSHYEDGRTSDVQVLMARQGGKKSNKFSTVKEARERWSDKLEQAKSAPILAVETRDDILAAIQHTELGDTESWRKTIQSVPLIERQYVKEIQEKLEAWRSDWIAGNGPREVCLYNFRTTMCVYYDLGL